MRAQHCHLNAGYLHRNIVNQSSSCFNAAFYAACALAVGNPGKMRPSAFQAHSEKDRKLCGQIEELPTSSEEEDLVVTSKQVFESLCSSL